MLNRLLTATHYVWNRYYLPFFVRRKGVILGRNVRFLGKPVISMAPGTSIRIGDDCVLCSAPENTALGVNHPVVLRTLRSGASISIGRSTGISGGSICAAHQITIGEECLIGANVTIADTDFHAIAPKGRRYNDDLTQIKCLPVEIEDNVFLGTGCAVLKGVSVGKNSVIGAFSVVTKSVARNSIVAGNPARPIGSV